MSEAKFTPAPWVIINQAGYEAINNDELGLNVCTFTSRVDDTSHDQALIAAAPEMYETMQEFVDRVECGEVRSVKTYSKFKAILAKARGEHD